MAEDGLGERGRTQTSLEGRTRREHLVSAYLDGNGGEGCLEAGDVILRERGGLTARLLGFESRRLAS